MFKRVTVSARMATAWMAATLLWATQARADDAPTGTEQLAVHGQATITEQGVGGFAEAYSGPNSLAARQVKETIDLTAYLGARPWRGAEIWINPEVDQGFGLSNTLGVAGFPSGEAYKVGKSAPYVRLQRLFVRQTVGLGGGSEAFAAAPNQLAGAQDRNRIVLTLGKFGVVDVFDTNRYAHDPRGDFLNWSVIDTGSFDYGADAWGYSYGAAAELYEGRWTLRAGLFNLSKIPNGEVLEHDLSQTMLVGEFEHRHSIGDRDGAVRVTAFRNRGRFARFDDALALARGTGQALDLAPARRTHNRVGIALNAEQDVTANLGVFLRAGTTDGAIETYDFTDIDRTLAFGGALKGKAWGRPQDTLAIAGVVNGISDAHKRWLAAGGLGVLVGDGALPHPGDEQIIEAYYAWRPVGWGSLTLDYQHIANPGYNKDRGPANILALRLHGGF